MHGFHYISCIMSISTKDTSKDNMHVYHVCPRTDRVQLQM